MKIASISVFQVDLPYSGGVYRLSGGREYRSFDAMVVRIETDDALEGWGESTPFGSTYVAAHARGVRAGIAEIAPALLGGRTDVRMPVISSIHAGEPDDMRRRVAEHRERGYLAHSVKIGAEPGLDAARIEASLADRRPGEFFIVDANGGMTVETALRMLRLLPAGLDFVLEAPCATWRECVSLRRRTDVPLIWDELASSDASVAQLVADDAAEGIDLKITKNGGLTRCRRQRDVCISAGLTMSVQDTVGSDIAFAAIVHMAQTVPRTLLRCLLESRDMVTVKTADGDFPVVDGHVTAPATPGLGITPRPDALGAPVATYA